MKIFISYRRKDWAHIHLLLDNLTRLLDVEIFVDMTSMDGTDFEGRILANLRDSDVVLLLVTPLTFAPDRIHKDDDWVRREIRETLTLDKKLVLVCVEGLFPPEDVPSDIQGVRGKEGIRFFAEPEFFCGRRAAAGELHHPDRAGYRAAGRRASSHRYPQRAKPGATRDATAANGPTAHAGRSAGAG
jgi:hypothetical protein